MLDSAGAGAYAFLQWLPSPVPRLLNLQGLVILVHMSFLQLNDIESVTSGRQLFDLADSVWGISVRL